MSFALILESAVITEMLQVIVEKDQRVPADLVLLRTTERSGACFVRTDQLDGETDWKLRLAVPAPQKLESDLQLFDIRASLFVEKPQRDIHSFIGTFTRVCIIFLLHDAILRQTTLLFTVYIQGVCE
jgi:magnesium-transporting ATPase (P-type)